VSATVEPRRPAAPLENPSLATPGATSGPSSAAPWRSLGRRLIHRPSGLVGLVLVGTLVLAAVFADSLTISHPQHTIGPSFDPPSMRFPMGTDNGGRDMWSSVLLGTRTSLLVVAAALFIAWTIGLAVGLLAGFASRLVDDLLMRFTELFFVVPRFFMVLLAIAFLGPGLDKLTVVIGLTSWALLARIVRAETLSARGRTFVEAARAAGASRPRILLQHVLPAVLPTAIVFSSLLASRVIVLEASLSYLGLGDPSRVSWGELVRQAQAFLRTAWWMWFFPGAAIVAAVLGLNLLADALNDALDPRGGAREVGGAIG